MSQALKDKTLEQQIDDLRAALATAENARNAWREFAEHQEHCAVCGESVGDCEEGSELKTKAVRTLKDAPTDKEE